MTRGEVYSIKSTGEQVTLLSSPDANGLVDIRRPKLTRDGIEYYLESAHKDELETIGEHEFRNAEYDCLKIDAQLIVKNKLELVRRLEESKDSVIDIGSRKPVN